MAEKLYHQEGDVKREYTSEEYAQNAQDYADYEAKLAKLASDQKKREAILTRLGITAEEVELLLSPKSIVIDNV